MYDIANLSNLPHLRNLSSTTMSAFENFDRAAMAAGAIPRRYKELIALGVAIATQCPYSLEVHRTNAENAGVTGPKLRKSFISPRRCEQRPLSRTVRILSGRAKQRADVGTSNQTACQAYNLQYADHFDHDDHELTAAIKVRCRPRGCVAEARCDFIDGFFIGRSPHWPFAKSR